MQLIKRVDVSHFRSIKDATISDLGHFSSLVGLNNAGKSNFLRALNAFFTGEVDRGVRINVEKDYYRPEVSKKKKKRISISVEFELPGIFHFRSGLEPVQELLGRHMTIKKEWTRDKVEPEIYINSNPEPLNIEDSHKVDQFVSLISFRYIPNRVIPTEIIIREHQALRDVLIRRFARLAQYSEQARSVFEGIQNTADQLTVNVGDQVRKLAPDIDGLRLSTAASLADLAFRFGYVLKEGDVEMVEDEQGSGLQSLLMFQTLHLIDQDFFQQFGWRQAAVWGIEEPESSMHTSLEAQVASYLAQISGRDGSRLQMIATTHSDLMIQYSDSSYIVDKRHAPTSVSPLNTTVDKIEKREALLRSARLGVSRWVNPILLYPLDPIVLVEGKTDKDFLERACAALGGHDRLRIISLSDLLENQDIGGVEQLRKYVQANTEAIKARAKGSPVIVLLDWDAALKVQEFQKMFKATDPFKALSWEESDANPQLDKSFRGVERFLSDRIISEAETTDTSLIATKKNGTKSVSPPDVPKLKGLLNGIVCKGIQPADCNYAAKLIAKLELLAKS